MSLSAKEKYDLSWGQPSDNGRAKRMVWGGGTTGGKVGCQNRPIILSYGAHAAVKRVLLPVFFSIFFANLYVSRVGDVRHVGWVELLDKDGGQETWSQTVPAVWSVDTWNLWATVTYVDFWGPINDCVGESMHDIHFPDIHHGNRDKWWAFDSWAGPKRGLFTVAWLWSMFISILIVVILSIIIITFSRAAMRRGCLARSPRAEFVTFSSPGKDLKVFFFLGLYPFYWDISNKDHFDASFLNNS